MNRVVLAAFLFLLGEKLNTSPSFPPCLLKAVPALGAPSSMQSNKHADGFSETRPILHPSVVDVAAGRLFAVPALHLGPGFTTFV